MECPRCNGTGVIACPWCPSGGHAVECPDCELGSDITEFIDQGAQAREIEAGADPVDVIDKDSP